MVDLLPVPTLPRMRSSVVPALIADAGDRAAYRFLEFFTASIRNPNTRSAYHRAVAGFLGWAGERGIGRLADISSYHVAAFVEHETRSKAAPTVKLELAAVRMLFDWLVVGQIVPANPAASVRGPRHIVKKGKTPVLSAEEARALLDACSTESAVGLRDRALIATFLYTFARVSAALGMNVADYFPQGRRMWVRLHEKGGKHHDMPAHHQLEEYLDAYVDAAGIAGERHEPLFRTAAGRSRVLTGNRMQRTEAYLMLKRRARDAGLATSICCHSGRATGITVYLSNGGSLEQAQRMAAHESPRTTKLYDRTSDQVSLDEVERIII